MVECIRLVGPDGLAEQTGTNDHKEVGHHDKENRKCWAKADAQYCIASELAPTLTGTTGEGVDQEATDEAAENPGNGGDGD
jgi:hypothetical protein